MVFYAFSIQCAEINAQLDLTSCFPNGNQIGNPLIILNKEIIPAFKSFSNSFRIVRRGTLPRVGQVVGNERL
jgi:hypothetical protein